MDLYDPNIHPSAADWLELDEPEKAEAVAAYAGARAIFSGLASADESNWDKDPV